MTLYLVLARCGIDDIPMMLLDNYETARTLAAAVTIRMVNQSPFARLAKLDVTELHGISVVTFKGGAVNFVENVGSFRERQPMALQIFDHNGGGGEG